MASNITIIPSRSLLAEASAFSSAPWLSRKAPSAMRTPSMPASTFRSFGRSFVKATELAQKHVQRGHMPLVLGKWFQLGWREEYATWTVLRREECMLFARSRTFVAASLWEDNMSPFLRDHRPSQAARLPPTDSPWQPRIVEPSHFTLAWCPRVVLSFRSVSSEFFKSTVSVDTQALSQHQRCIQHKMSQELDHAGQCEFATEQATKPAPGCLQRMQIRKRYVARHEPANIKQDALK